MTYIALTVALLALLPQGAHGMELTVNDISIGMASRRSQITSYKLEYERRLVRTPYFFERSALQRQRLVNNSVPADRIPPTPDKIIREEKGRYRLKWKSGKIAYDILSTAAETEGDVVQTGVYDGEIFKGLLIEDKRGTVARREPSRIGDFRRPGDLMLMDGRDITELLDDDEIGKEIVAASVSDGASPVDLRLTRVLRSVPFNGTALDKSQEYLVSVDASRAFWPTSVESFGCYKNLADGEQLKVLKARVTLESFVETGGGYYPRVIRREEFSAEVGPVAPGKSVPELTKTELVSTETITVIAVSLNTDLDDSDFQLEFPEGTSYLDEIDGATYLVGADHTVEKLVNDMIGGPEMPASKYTKSEFEEAYRKHDAETRPRVSEGAASIRIWLVYGNIAIGCLAVGFFAAKAVRRRLRGRAS